MSVFAIPNPRKTMQVDFSMDKVKNAVKNISLLNPKYRLSSINEGFNQYTYESFEFLSLGVYIDIQLNSINSEKTEINVEIRRKVGTFNQSHEVTNANNHIVNIFNYLSTLCVMPESEIIALHEKTVNANNPKNPNAKSKNITTILALLLGGIGIHRFYLGQNKLGIFYLIFCWTFVPLVISFFDFLAFAFMSEEKFNLKYNFG